MRQFYAAMADLIQFISILSEGIWRKIAKFATLSQIATT